MERIQNVSPKEYNGTMYRSTLEADTARTLDALGIPFEYESRKITLQDGFHSPYQKDKVRAITYTPDFVIGPVMLECKGFETPEWKIKKKLVYKWLQENEPETIFYQIHDCRKQLIQALDPHLTYLGYCIQVTPAKKKRQEEVRTFDSIQQAFAELGLTGKSEAAVLKNLIGKTPFTYGYEWKITKINI